MTGAAQPIEWYLARDNKQFGPLSDVELMKLVELRHLKPQDLVWRAGFTDWTPAGSAFPQAFAPAQPMPAPAPLAPAPIRDAEFQREASVPQGRTGDPLGSQPVSSSSRSMDRTVAAATAGRDFPAAAQPSPNIETLSDYRARAGSRPESVSAAVQEPGSDHGAIAANTHIGPDGGRTAAPEGLRPAQRRLWIAPAEAEENPSQPAPQHAANAGYPPRPGPSFASPFSPASPGRYAPNALDATDRDTVDRFRRSAPAGAVQGSADHIGPRRIDAATQPFDYEPARDGRSVPTSAPAHASDDLDDEFDEPRRPRRIWGLIAVLFLLSVMTAATWLLVSHPHVVKQLITNVTSIALRGSDSRAPAPAENRASRAAAASSRDQAASPANPRPAGKMYEFSESVAAIDEMLLSGHLWQSVKAEFPEWYAERVREAARLVSEKKPDEVVTKHLVDALISLRRKNADSAFQASLAKLQMIARTFRDSLEQLTRHSDVACYALISSGEGTKGMIALFRDPTYSPVLQTGMAAVFEAVADGRTTPNNVLAARRADYDMLTKELTVLGWKEQEVSLFADAQALAKSPPGQVCRMVQEWFTAHLAIQDPGVQHRLLVESLRPVIAG